MFNTTKSTINIKSVFFSKVRLQQPGGENEAQIGKEKYVKMLMQHTHTHTHGNNRGMMRKTHTDDITRQRGDNMW